MNIKAFSFAAALMAASALSGVAMADSIYTGGKTGFYYAAGQGLSQQLAFPYAYDVQESPGTLANIDSVLKDPKSIGLAQGDVLANELATKPDLASKIVSMPLSGVNECIFMAVKSARPVTLGTLAKYGKQVTFFEPANSGSEATLKILQGMQPNGLGLAKIVEVGSADEGIQKALATAGGATLFVQLPDPSNDRFKAVVSGGGQFVTVGGTSLEKLTVGGKQVYHPIPTSVSGPTAVVTPGSPPAIKTQQLTTTCMEAALVTGNPAALDGDAKAAQDSLVASLQEINPQALLPKQGPFAGFMGWMKKMTALSGSKLNDFYNQVQSDLN